MWLTYASKSPCFIVIPCIFNSHFLFHNLAMFSSSSSGQKHIAISITDSLLQLIVLTSVFVLQMFVPHKENGHMLKFLEVKFGLNMTK